MRKQTRSAGQPKLEDVGETRNALDREALEAETGSPTVSGKAHDVQAVTGIDASATRGALSRSVQESASRETARILCEMEEVAGPSDRLIVAGGWTRSDAYRAIKRGVLGPFEVPEVVEAGAHGAALFGGLAAGLYTSVDDFPLPTPETE